MPDSNTEICNLALKAIGLDPIASLATDTSQTGIVLRNTWEATRDAVLRAANWRCLLRREGPLAREAAAPAFGYSYAYALPVSYIRVVEMSVDAKWEVEGRLLLTDESEAYIRFVGYDKPSDPVYLLDAHLVAAIVAQLAVNIAPGLKSKTMVAALEVIARDRLADAKLFSAIEKRPETANPTALLDVR